MQIACIFNLALLKGKELEEIDLFGVTHYDSAE